MRTVREALLVLVTLASGASAQDNLVPDASVLVEPDSHLLKIRHVFADAFARGVSLRAVVITSFEKEYVVGVRWFEGKTEAFTMDASSSIWDTEVVDGYEAGRLGAFGPDHKPIPLDQNKHFQALKKRTPADYRTIKPIVQARPLPDGLEKKIEAMWSTMLLEVKHPEEGGMDLDGVSYHFSANVDGSRELSGHSDNPEDGRVKRLAAVADALRNFARGKIDEASLKKEVNSAEAIIKRRPSGKKP